MTERSPRMLDGIWFYCLCGCGLLIGCIGAVFTHGEARRDAMVATAFEKIAEALPGGTRDRPIEVVSWSVIEVVARSMPCPLCDGSLCMSEHAAATIGGERLRVSRTTCSGCGSSWRLYFRIKRLV